jgi:hypothetical protein
LIDQHDSTIRFSLRHMFGVTAFIALTLGVVSYTGSIAYGIHLSLCLAGWVMWRIGHGHLGGLIPALLGGDLLLCLSVGWIMSGSEDFLGIRVIMGVFASLFVFVGVGVLLWISTKKRRFWKHQIAIAAAILFILAVWWAAVPMLGNATIARRQTADIAANNLATAKAIAMVEKVRQQIGAVPDESALSELLKEPLPSVRWDGLSDQIRYARTSDATYQLIYFDISMLLFPDYVIYDSATPKKGWYRIPF